MEFFKRNLTDFVFLIASVIVLAVSFTAADEFVAGGTGISLIESVGGRTLEESYYYQLGHIYKGYAFMCRSIGVSLSAIMMWLGVSDLLKNEENEKKYKDSRDC